MKKFLPFILTVCLLFSLSACSNETIEGKYYYAWDSFERYNDQYVELFLDGTYEMYNSWCNWWDENGQEHEKCTGNYEIKRQNNIKYIKFQFPDELLTRLPGLVNYVLYIYSDTVLSAYPTAKHGNYVKE